MNSKNKQIQTVNSIDTTQTPAPAAKFSIAKSDPRLLRLAKLGIEYRDTIKGKPVFVVQSKAVINLHSDFGHKKLCDGPSFTTGHACGFTCTFCFVEAQLWGNKKINAILKEMGLEFGGIKVEIANPGQVAREFLTRKGVPRFNDPNDTRVIYGSPIIDIAATMGDVEQTAEVCLAILQLTHWQIRVLSKSSLLSQLAKRIPEEFKPRMKYGLSTGTLDDGMARIFEIGTALPSKRIEALHWLQDNGYRTFGMPCPTLPQQDYDAFAAEMAAALRVDRCEHIWVEVLNPRGDSLPATTAALRKAGYTWQADQLELVARDKSAWERYARQTYEAFVKVIPTEKLRFLQYVNSKSYNWWKEREAQGVIVLGKFVKRIEGQIINKKPGLNGKLQFKGDPLSEEEKKLWSECRKGIRHEFKVCLGSYVKLGKLLATVRDKQLHREERGGPLFLDHWLS